MEIMTNWGGEGLEYKLAERHLDVMGILNGIDEKLNNPADDIDIPYSFSSDDLSGKIKCRKELRKEAGLPLAAMIMGFLVAFWLFSPGASAETSAAARVEGAIGSGKAVLLEFQSPY